jgi:uncharacterized lipoprotein YddW (UPF0748 family)
MRARSSAHLRSAIRLVIVLGAAVGSLTLSAATTRRTATDEVRALWVTRATLESPAAIADMVSAAQAGGFNTLIVQVRARGDAYYDSSIEPRPPALAARPEFDPLAEVLTRARPAGLKVHAWINVNLISSAAYLPTSRQHIVYRHPEWLMVPRELASEMRTIDPGSPEYLGRLARWTRARLDTVEGLYMSPLHADAAAHVAAIASEIVRRYDVAGIHLDYARFPGEQFDYGRAALLQFKHSLRNLDEAERIRLDAQEQLDPLAYPNHFPQRWQTFRQSRTTGLVMRVKTAVKAVRPDTIISAAVLPDAEVAASVRMQDWRTWLDQSLIDVLCPMAYAVDADQFSRQIESALLLAGEIPVWAGVAAYRLSPTAILRHIDVAREHKVSGVILFSYDSLVTPPNSTSSLTSLARAAFGAVDGSKVDR